MHTYIHIYIYTYICKNIYIYIYIYIYVCMYVCMYVCVCVYASKAIRGPWEGRLCFFGCFCLPVVSQQTKATNSNPGEVSGFCCVFRSLHPCKKEDADTGIPVRGKSTKPNTTKPKRIFWDTPNRETKWQEFRELIIIVFCICCCGFGLSSRRTATGTMPRVLRLGHMKDSYWDSAARVGLS